MNTYWIFGLGFFAQLLFGLRIIVQWWLAEKKKQVVSPSLFWNLSLAGATFFLVYGILRHDIVIIIGQLVSYFIYVRNLQLKQDWNNFPSILKVFLIAVPIGAILFVALSPTKRIFPQELIQGVSLFFIIGITGQSLLNLRFMYQLYYSERHKESILPKGFWWISMAGSLFMICYSIYRHDPVLLVAQGLAIVPYLRNLSLAGKSKIKTYSYSPPVSPAFRDNRCLRNENHRP